MRSRFTFTIPSWLSYPLMWLGAMNLVFTPLAIAWNLWALYVAEVVFAIIIGWSARRQIRHTTLLRGGRSQITWWRYGPPTPEEEQGLTPEITWSPAETRPIPSPSPPPTD